MADTILILGNGFDLAMGRKTSYKDFIEFADKLFVERDDQLDEFLKKHQIDIEKYRNNLYIQYINENKSTLGENWSNLEIMISQLAEAIDFFRLNSDKLYHKNGNLYPEYVDRFHKMMNEEDNSCLLYTSWCSSIRNSRFHVLKMRLLFGRIVNICNN